MTEVLLRIDRLTVDLPRGADRAHAVEDVSLDLSPNEILCVVGESGSGKTVMGRTVMRLLDRTHLKPSSGTIMFHGEDLLRVREARMRQLRGDRISMVFQEPMTALNPLMTVGRQVDELLRLHRTMRYEERKRKTLELFEAVFLPDPERIYASYPHQLSGGQRQRAVIAMAFVLEPDIVIADEPTTALDVTTEAQILKLIKQLQRTRDTAFLFITHDFGVVAEIADRVAVMQHGRVVEAGTTAGILDAPEHPYTRQLLDAVPRLHPREPRQLDKTDEILSVRHLTKTFGRRKRLFRPATRGVEAVKKVSLSLRRGETLGVVGESGSGKSTLARCVIRLLDADEGEILLSGVDIGGLSRKELRPWRKQIQMVFQDPYESLNPRMTVGQLVAQGPLVHGASHEAAMQRVRELLGLVGLDPNVVDRYPHEFSGGQRQRIGIARALALSPEVLVADEPVSALDVSVQAQVLRLLDDIRVHFNLAMLFITHDLRVAAQVCDRVVVMHNGDIVEEAPTAELFARPQHPYTKSLLDAVPGKDWEARRDGQQRPEVGTPREGASGP
jgi:peptide/nickel transport system ATP-binding protein